MKRSSNPLDLRITLVLGLAVFPLTQSLAAIFTTDTVIAPDNLAYENADIVVSNATLTVDGPHTFANLLVGSGGTVTHTFSANGTMPTNFVVHDAQFLTDTNEVLLVNSNIVLASIVVRDFSGTITYQANTNYLVRASGVDTFLRRSETSAISNNSIVLLSYSIAAGLNVTLTGNLDVNEGGFITANGRGSSVAGAGASAGNPPSGSGGGYGGYGGLSSSNALGGNCYGVIPSPTSFGSRGGNGSGGLGAPGGGLIRLNVAGTAHVDGMISANGLNATNSRSGGGSGGSIWITAQTVSGAGAITAHGGNGEPIHGGGGGGGRIAVQSETNVFTGVVAAYGGTGWRAGGAGSVFTKLDSDPGLVLYDNNNQAGTNSLIANPNQSDIIIRAGAGATVSGAWFARDISIASNSFLNPIGSFLTINVSNLNLAAGAQIRADGIGSGPAQGSGAGASLGTLGGGGGHGGLGGRASNISFGGNEHGIESGPTTIGSGGGGVGSIGGSGGGNVRLVVGGTLQLDGTISANGTTASGGNGGGGAGGAIYLTLGGLSGSGIISANGGNAMASGGGGGGGRIAILYTSNSFAGNITAVGGAGTNAGGAGTIYLKPSNTRAALIMNNGGRIGARTSFGSGVSGGYDSVTIAGGTMAANVPPVSLSMGNLLIASNSWLFSGNTLTITGLVTIQATGGINVDGTSSSGSGNGFNLGAGGGYGGYGGQGSNTFSAAGNAYGSASQPLNGGSVGYPGSSGGGWGGGYVFITGGAAMTVDGTISANGVSGTSVQTGNSGIGGGSGGSVRLNARSLSGAGRISANGGAGTNGGGGGGGGRIAIYCNTNTFTGIVSAFGGTGYRIGGAGTIYFNAYNGQPSTGAILVDNGGNFGANTTYESSFTGDLTVSGGGTPVLGGSTLRKVLIKTNGILFAPVSQLTLSSNLTIDAGGLFSLDGVGYSQIPGAGWNGNPRGGAGHGGYGAMNPNNFGDAYDSITSPSLPGSRGGGGVTSPPYAGLGGGALRLQFAGFNTVLTVNGCLSANGLPGDSNMGGGSGGSLWLTVGTLAGSGIISANGGSGSGTGGAGGGGRISIGYNTNLFTGQITAFGGAGTVAGGAGTIYTKFNNATVGPLLIDNGGQSGTNTPLSSSFNLPTFPPFNLAISGGASVFALTPLPQLSNLVINASSVLTMRPSETNISLYVSRDATIAAGGAINVDGKGFGPGLGTAPGASLYSQGAGGGHGGAGGNSQSGALGGTNYGSIAQPVLRGSGGGSGSSIYSGGNEGGGAIRLTVGGTLNLAGSVTANGNPGIQDDSGGGAGGSVWITAGRLIGGGAITASGGAGDLFGGGGGGGGCVAVYCPTNEFAGSYDVTGGFSFEGGETGTVFVSTNLGPPFSITGTVTDGSGQPVAGVTLRAVSSGTTNDITISDGNGNFSFTLFGGWSGKVIPAHTSNVFVPSARSYNTAMTSLNGQNFTMLPSVTPVLTTSLVGTNLQINWTGVGGVHYSLHASTNLTTWTYLTGVPGTNGVTHQLLWNMDAPAKYFRIWASY